MPLAEEKQKKDLAVQLGSGLNQIWDIRSKRLLSQFTLTSSTAAPAEFNSRNRRLFFDNFDRADFHAWDLEKGQLEQSWTGPDSDGFIHGFTTPDERCRVQLNVRGKGIIRDAAAQTTEAFTISIEQAGAGAFSRDGKFLAVTSLLSYVRLWEWPVRREIATMRGFLQGVHGVAFSPDGRRLGACSSGQEALKLYDLKTYRELITLKAKGSIFGELRFSSDGNLIGARSSAGRVHIWRALSFEEIEDAPKEGSRAGVAFRAE